VGTCIGAGRLVVRVGGVGRLTICVFISHVGFWLLARRGGGEPEWAVARADDPLQPSSEQQVLPTVPLASDIDIDAVSLSLSRARYTNAADTVVRGCGGCVALLLPARRCSSLPHLRSPGCPSQQALRLPPRHWRRWPRLAAAASQVLPLPPPACVWPCPAAD
jgi:hypothetical protein